MKGIGEIQIRSGNKWVPINPGDVALSDGSGKVFAIGELADMAVSQEAEIEGLRELLRRYQELSGNSMKLMAASLDLISQHDRENTQAIEDLKQSLNDLKGIQEASK